MKLSAIIIDDEKLGRELVLNYLKEHKDVEVIAECSNGFEGVKAINNLKPDIIFLDIQMPKINGFELLEIIEHSPAVIFTTAYDQYAIKAFEKNAVDYLLKPFSAERFAQALEKAKNQLSLNEGVKKNIIPDFEPETYLNRIVVKNRNNIEVIPVDTINYITAEDDYVQIVCKKGKYLKKKTMSYYERNLDPKNFVRIHRSVIINITYLDKVELAGKEQYQAITKDGTKLPISKSGYANLKEVMEM